MLVRPRLGGAGVVLVLIASSHAVIHAYSTLMPLVYPHALQDLHFSLAALGIMVAVSSVSGGFLQLAAGALTRVIRRHALIGWGALLMGASGIVTATASGFAQFFAGNLARAVVTSPQHPVGNALLADLYGEDRRGMAIGGHVAGGNVGTVLLTPAAGILIAVWGWRPVVLLLTIPALLAGLAILTSIQESPSPRRQQSAMRDLWAGLKAVQRSRNLTLIFAASLVAAGGRGLGVVTLVVPLYLKLRLQLDDTTVTLLYSLLLFGGVAGPLIGGRISDRLGRRGVLLVIYVLSALLTAGLLGTPANPLLLGLVLAALGLVVYEESPLLQTFVADEAPSLNRDAIFSLYFAVAFGVGALWAAWIGIALGWFGFTPVFMTMVATYLLAAICVWAMRDSRRAAGSTTAA